MNKNMKYWATGIIAAIVILAIAAFAAAGSRKKAPIPPAPTEMESSSQTAEQSSGSAESKNSMDHSGPGGSDAASDDDTNRYLQRCPYKNTNRQRQDEQHDSTYCPDHLFSPVLLLPVSSSSICLHTSPACFSLARMFGRASLSV